jgi:FAD/FMN-containing dehydrogenase
MIETIRKDLIAMWTGFGCAHLQIGKTYSFLPSRRPEPMSLLKGLKQVVDPHSRMNPGSIGLD